MWLGVPHVSRMHCTISRSHDIELVVKDLSTNGTYYDEGVLEKGDSLAIHSEPKVLDFGGGVTVAICFNEDQEKAFIESRGSPMVFAERRTHRTTRAGRGTKSFSAAALQAEIGQNLSNAPAGAAEPHLLNFLESFKTSFRSMDKRGRMMFYAIVAAVVFIFVVLGLLLKPFFY